MSRLFLNEHSCDKTADRHRAAAAMNALATALTRVRRMSPDTALICTEELSFPHWTIGENYSAVQWMNENGANRERARLLMGLQQRAPFRIPAQGLDPESEYSHRGRVGRAFQATDLHDGMTVSLPIAPDWKEPWLSVTRLHPEEDDDGTVELRSANINLRHCSREHHTAEHEEWLRREGLEKLTTGAALWEGRERYFPHLEFLPRVEGNLRGLDHAWVAQVRKHLRKLEEAVAEWRINDDGMLVYSSKVTVESESRVNRGEVDFTDLDGCVRAFQLHSRFTPGNGRIHFRLIPERKRARIAHIGGKLGA